METILAAVVVITGLGLILGYGLAFAAKRLEVIRDERTNEIMSVLPGMNCGACGFPGCIGYADAIVRDGVAINLCPPGGSKTIAAVGKVMGIETAVGIVRVARVHCAGGDDLCQQKYRYNGLADCRSVHNLFGGFRTCPDGCLGLGSCVRVCCFDAIKINDVGHVRIIEENCTACTLCVQACPLGLIEMVSPDKRVHILCNSHEKGASANKICKVSCIGCSRCVKTCKQNAMRLENYLAIIDYAACISCGECAAVCPKKCIAHYSVPQASVHARK